jgi:radical SAM/Cys-rich protein
MSLPNFAALLAERALPELRRDAVATLQVNVGRRCDLACHHCHVEAGPKRSESMSKATAARVIELLAANPEVGTLDLTGGAPELNENFRALVSEARALGREVIDRCNLTILFEPGQEDTAEFLAEQGVKVVASLPCYTRENVDAQRGKRVFERSIAALRRLNELGYARPGNGLALDLVYNPLGPSLPPDQSTLEATYRSELREMFDIEFDRLATITNMPIKRFAHALERDGRAAEYMALLVNHFNPDTLPALMCRSLVSVGWDGAVYDCDFNQMLELPLGASLAQRAQVSHGERKFRAASASFAQRAEGERRPAVGRAKTSSGASEDQQWGERRPSGGGARTIWELDDLGTLARKPIATASHCFGCTAGSGSSCGGALT